MREIVRMDTCTRRAWPIATIVLTLPLLGGTPPDRSGCRPEPFPESCPPREELCEPSALTEPEDGQCIVFNDEGEETLEGDTCLFAVCTTAHGPACVPNYGRIDARIADLEFGFQAPEIKKIQCEPREPFEKRCCYLVEIYEGQGTDPCSYTYTDTDTGDGDSLH